MIIVYRRESDRIANTSLAQGQPIPPDAVWVDLLNPTDDERAFAAKALNLDLPTASEMREIEASSRLFTDGDTLFLTLDVLGGSDTPAPVLDALLIAIGPKAFLTARFCEPKSMINFAARIKQQPDLIATPQDALLALLDAVTDRMADILEVLGKNADILSGQIFRRGATGKKEKHMQEILQSIGHAGATTQKIRDSISGMTRLLTFLGPNIAPKLNPEQKRKLQALERDISSLTEHAQFATQELSFLLDATLGQINIEQNNIIKFLSIVMVAFTPPTFFASMWGMNFHDMPEYAWSWGYPMAWIVMVVSAVLPLLYFKRRNWM